MKREVIALKKAELAAEIKAVEEKIKEYQRKLRELTAEWEEFIAQEREREYYISSKEIIDLILAHTGKLSNMSMIKRWADEGYLGEVVDEKDKFWTLRSKQGKKRFLYPKKTVYSFLYEKGLIHPKFEVLDRVRISRQTENADIGTVVQFALTDAEFYYTVQLEATGEIVKAVKETQLELAQERSGAE